MGPEGGIDWLLWASIPTALLAGLLLGLSSSFTLVALALVGMLFSYLIALDQRALVAVVVVATAIFIDFCQVLTLPFYFPTLATVMAVSFLISGFLLNSAERRWVRVPHLRWWACLLVLALLPALRGGVLEGARYYVTVLFNALLLYIIGVQAVRDLSRLRRVFSVLAGFATLIAIHSILQAQTGNVLLPTHYWDSYLSSVKYFALPGSHSIRAGSFFINPDSDGAFLGIMFYLPLSLLLVSPSRLWRGWYLLEAVLILLGLLFTYSLASIIAICAGGVFFLLLIGRQRYLLYAFGLICILLLVMDIAFPSLLHLLMNRVSNPRELLLRLGAWETGIRVIVAHPLVGLGLSFYTYIIGAEPYRVALQDKPLAHPHNSFLELGALGGLPVLILFALIYGKTLWLAFRNYREGEKAQRILLAGGLTALAIATINSFAANTWTFPPLVTVNWLIAGALSSPTLMQPLTSRFSREKRSSEAERASDQLPMLSGGVQA